MDMVFQINKLAIPVAPPPPPSPMEMGNNYSLPLGMAGEGQNTYLESYSKQVQANIISIAGQSGSGKTTFLEKLIPHLSKKGYRIGVIKHAHCKVEMEKKGKDSWRHKEAGAAATLVISPNLISMVKDYKEPNFVGELIDAKQENVNYYESVVIKNARNYLFDMDIIIVEGFKYAPIPKLEIFRVAAGHDKPLFLDDKNLVGFITDSDYRVNVPCFGLGDTKLVADFIENKYLIC